MRNFLVGNELFAVSSARTSTMWTSGEKR